MSLSGEAFGEKTQIRRREPIALALKDRESRVDEGQLGGREKWLTAGQTQISSLSDRNSLQDAHRGGACLRAVQNRTGRYTQRLGWGRKGRLPAHILDQRCRPVLRRAAEQGGTGAPDAPELSVNARVAESCTAFEPEAGD